MTSAEAVEIKSILTEFKASVDQRFDRLERKVDDLAEVVQGIAKGFPRRVDTIENQLMQAEGRGGVLESRFPEVGR